MPRTVLMILRPQFSLLMIIVVSTMRRNFNDCGPHWISWAKITALTDGSNDQPLIMIVNCARRSELSEGRCAQRVLGTEPPMTGTQQTLLRQRRAETITHHHRLNKIGVIRKIQRIMTKSAVLCVEIRNTHRGVTLSVKMMTDFSSFVLVYFGGVEFRTLIQYVTVNYKNGEVIICVCDNLWSIEYRLFTWWM